MRDYARAKLETVVNVSRVAVWDRRPPRGLCVVQCGEAALEPSLRQRYVSVDRRDQRSPSVGNRDRSCMPAPSVLLQGYHADGMIFARRIPLCDRDGGVGRAVVDDNDLVIGESALSAYRAK